MSLNSLFSKMLVLFIFLAVGVLCGRLNFLDEASSKKLNKILLNICAPALVFSSVLTTEYSYAFGEILALLLDAAAFDVLMIVLALVLVPIYCRDSERCVFRFMTGFGNTVCMGFPVIASLYGNDAVFLGSVCSIPFNLLIYSVGVLMIGGKGDRNAIRRMLLNPPFIANILAFLIFAFRLKVPAPVEESLSYLGNMVIPLSLILVGFSLQQMPAKEIFGDPRVYVLCLCKLVIAPLAVFFVFRLFVRDSIFLNIIVISAAMPVASITPILCSEYGGSILTGSKGVFLSTLLSMLTVPLMLSFLLT